MRTLNCARRTASVAAIVFRACVALSIQSAVDVLNGTLRPAMRIGESLAWTFETLGGGYLKIGQVLSTRADILPWDLVAALQRLQDAVPALSANEVRQVVERTLGRSLDDVFSYFDPHPVGSASIAQVHRAVVRKSGEVVAIKIRRPGIDRIVRTDADILCALVRAVSFLPVLRRMPIAESVRQVASSIVAQTSLHREAEQHRRFLTLFPQGVPVRVPRLLDEYCSDEILVMEYVPDLVKITDPVLSCETHRHAVITGLHGLYTMLFLGGVVHCDLHPGNILVGRDGDVVVLDFGFATAMSIPERVAFARFFLSIAFNDGSTATRIVLDTALRVPADLDHAGFEREISALVDRSSGLRAADFLIASFVDSLFTIQRKHRVYGSPSFTMAIVSLVVYEGIIRQRCADLDFQREAVPTLLRALQTS
jgi:ubiquinone biosynthesis protein